MVSKTKIGAVLAGLGAVLTTVSGIWTGTLDIGTGISAILLEIGIVVGIFGIRDIPFFN